MPKGCRRDGWCKRTNVVLGKQSFPSHTGVIETSSCKPLDLPAISGEEPAVCPLCQTPLSESSAVRYPTVALAYDTSGVCLTHEGPDHHPESARRLNAVLKRVQTRGFCHQFYRIPSRTASVDEICAGHHHAYWKTVNQLSSANADRAPQASDIESKKTFTCYGEDLYYCATTAAAAATALGTTLNLVDTIMDPLSPVTTGFALVRPPGHHASAQRAMGFCFLNNVAIAARQLKRRHRLSRIMIIDFDVHHGNGTQDLLCRDPSFLYFSIHRHDNGKFYPRRGNAEEVGSAAGKGYTVNIPLTAGYGDQDVYVVAREVLVPVVTAYKPQYILVSAGYDAAEGDPLGGCRVTPRCFGWLCRQISRIARRYANGRAAFVLEGGYNEAVLADCVEACLESLGTVSLEQKNESLDATFHLERFPGVERPTSVSLLKRIATLDSRFPHTQTTFTYDELVDHQTLFALDKRYDFVSQLKVQCDGDGVAQNQVLVPFTIHRCPTVWCCKATQASLGTVYQKHHNGPLRLPGVTPFVTKAQNNFYLKLIVVSPRIDVPSSGSFLSTRHSVFMVESNAVAVKSMIQASVSKHHDLVVSQKEALRQPAFEPVGGHLNQWHVDPCGAAGYIIKATTYCEAMFYWWVSATEGNIKFRVTPSSRDTAPETFDTLVSQFKSLTPQHIASTAAMFKKLQVLIPKCVSIGLPFDGNPNGPYHVEMENLLDRFHQPCVMDLKMGVRMYADNATFEKRQRMIHKAASSTSLKYGIRLTAWKVWSSNQEESQMLTRAEASQITQLSQLQRSFDRYLDAASLKRRKTIATLFKAKVQELYEWFSTQTIAQFYSSSLLFLYDASDSHFWVDVRMIDFAHVTFHPATFDTGYLHGLATLLSLLDAYLLKHPDEA